MKLNKIFFKLSIIGNIKNYLKGMASVIITILVFIVSNNLFENMKAKNMGLSPSFMYLSFKYSSIQTILIIASGIFIINQFYHIMRSSSKDYIIIKALGATKNQIRSLIFIQAVLLFLFTVPLGICIGMTASDFILNSLSEFAVHKLKLLDSSIIILFISGMISCAIIVIGILLEIGSRRKRPFQISS